MSLDLVVLQISESDLRSALTARLTMVGINVATIGADQPAQGIPGITIMTAILVTDDDAIGQTACEASPGWLQVIVLDESSSNLDDRPVRLPRRGATRRIVEVLDGWRGPRAEGVISESRPPPQSI